MKKAFTLIELLVAVGILAVMVSFSGVILKAGIESNRVAAANAEIMRNLRAITDQLNSDFKGLRKDGEIFIAWVAVPTDEADPLLGYTRFDRIMFFANGDFHTQKLQANGKIVRGNVARICYMLAKRTDDRSTRAREQLPQDRILSRTQHILTFANDLDRIDPTTFTLDQDWYDWKGRIEYDKTTLQQWINIPLNSEKADMLSVLTDVVVSPSTITVAPSTLVGGTTVDPGNPYSVHMLFCQGVGEFKIQGWSDQYERWIPEVDPDGDGDLRDSDFNWVGTEIDTEDVPGLLYNPRNGVLKLWGNVEVDPDMPMDEEHFEQIPGLGRALKFTFTLYDSKDIIPDGRTFTHIVYLDD